MAVYVDNTNNQCRGMLMFHMADYTLEELHAIEFSDYEVP